jgi:hypothetical protein
MSTAGADEANQGGGAAARQPAGDRGPPRRGRAFAFDVDAVSLASLREALPRWELVALDGATAASLASAWDPGSVDLLVVGVRAGAADVAGL